MSELLVSLPTQPDIHVTVIDGAAAAAAADGRRLDTRRGVLGRGRQDLRVNTGGGDVWWTAWCNGRQTASE